MTEPKLIDTHTHLYFDQFESDLDAVVGRAQGADVIAMLVVGIDYESSLQAVSTAEKYDFIFAAVGVHPHDAKDMTDEHFDAIRDLLNHPKVVAIGEIGLDYHYDYSPRDVQRRVFRRFLDLSQESKKPVIIHTREADEDILDVIQGRSRHNWSGVFHCFSGDVPMAEKAIELGFHISFTGNITFKRSRSIDVAAALPLNRLMVETDCPFMSPVPKRGRRNEPAFVQYVASRLAKAKNIPVEQVARITTQNAVSLFNLPLEMDS
ncbi:MAG: TatD family hydrolase [candidate division KSB1 bacterium]|nr:TatD family hydrolase [candidate division KSB1 bacterium]